MANTQLTAYASAQLDKGVSREAITQALVGAGWMQADVDAAMAEVMAQRAGTMNVAVTPGANPTVTVSQTQPAASAEAQPVTTTVTTTTAPASQSVTPASFFATTPSMSMDAAATSPKRSMTWLFVLVGILLALGIIGAVAYVLLGGSGASAVIPNSDELTATQQERDQLRASVTALTDEQTKYQNEVSFFEATTTPSVTSTIAGKLTTTTAGAWILTTSHNIVITVSNAKDAAVAQALAPLKDADVTLTGTHAPGSTLLKVTAVNGTTIAVATTATSTSTASSTSAAH